MDNLKHILKHFKAILNKAPKVVGRMAVDHFKQNFEVQGFVNNGLQKWPERKKRKKDKGRAILVKSGNLRDSIDIVSADTQHIVIGTNMPYAKLHNEGGTIHRSSMSRLYIQNRFKAGKNKGKFKKGTTRGKGGTIKAYDIKIPKRQFIGNSKELNDKIEQWFTKRISETLNNS
jgi:phage gpG-like protein